MRGLQPSEPSGNEMTHVDSTRTLGSRVNAQETFAEIVWNQSFIHPIIQQSLIQRLQCPSPGAEETKVYKLRQSVSQV